MGDSWSDDPPARGNDHDDDDDAAASFFFVVLFFDNELWLSPTVSIDLRNLSDVNGT
jgi:hypothetical protein